jgi:hypothetical protein
VNGLGAVYTLQVRKGNSRHFNVAVYESDGTTAKDMSTETIQYVFSQNGRAVFTLTEGDGLTVTLGNIAVTLSSTRTAMLDNTLNPKHELEFITDVNNSPCILYGDVRTVDGLNG